MEQNATEKSRTGLGYLYLINTVVLFSSFEVVNKMLVGKLDTFQVNFIRFFIGGLVLFIFLLIKGDLKISLDNFLRAALLGIINVGISMNFLQIALYTEGAKASVVAVIFSSNPIFVLIFSALFDKEKIPVYKILGAFAGIVGLLVIFLQDLNLESLNIKSPLFALMSAVFYALFTLLGRRVSVKIGSLKMNAYSFLAGSLAVLPFLLFFKIPVMKFDPSYIPHMAYLSLFVSGIAYLTFFKGLEIVGASSGSLVFFIKPPLASILAAILLREHITPNLMAGTALIIAGILIIVYWPGIRERLSARQRKKE